jgi:tetratricopeptide (TPR) repeat protein
MIANGFRRACLALPFLLLFLLGACLSVHPQSTTSNIFDSLSKRAAAARDADRLDDAVALYKKALALHPKWAEGWWSLGTIEYDRNNYAAAARAFRQLLSLAPKNGTAHVMLGLCEFELGQDSAALKHLQEGKGLGVSTNPQLRMVTLYHEGLLLLRAGQFKAAQASLMDTCAHELQGEDVLQSLGLAFLRVLPKDAPPAGTPGGQVVLRVGRAACFTGGKKYDDARREYQSVVDEYPAYPNIHYAYGRFLVDVNDATAGMDQFKLELQNQPNDVNSRLEIAAAQYKLDSAAGIPYAEDAVKLNPHLPFAHYLLGLLYVDIANFEKAIPQLELAEKAFPRDARLQLALASAYSRVGRKQDAARARATYERLSKEPGTTGQASY